MLERMVWSWAITYRRGQHMYKLLLILLVLGSQFTFTACTIQRVPLTPLTDAERQTLGTIGIAAEVSRLETQYSRDPSIVDDGLRAMQDRLP